jgi:dTDP-glucose pyrophosphorylase
MLSLDESSLPSTASIANAIERLELTEAKIVLVVDHDFRLLGTITDGDVRRGIIRGIGLEESVAKIMNPNPTTASAAVPREELLAMMKQQDYRHLPLVDEAGRVVGIETLSELLTPQLRENVVILMAGGLGARLRPLTADRPKPLIHVGPRPILETVIQGFLTHGFRRFYISVSYRAEMVEEYFGDGARWGATIEYLREAQPLGTAGAIGLLPTVPAEPVLIMNADLLTKLNFSNLLDFHCSNEAAATICVRDHSFQFPYGVVALDDSVVTSIHEKPIYRDFVNAGVYALEPHLISRVDPGTPLDMTTLLQQAIHDGEKVVAFPISEYWMDIGQMDDLRQANLDFDRIS